MGISACLIVQNEERFLRDCLNSIAGVVDEICLMDTGSNDQTLDIARDFKCKIRHFTWGDDFSAARNACLEMATQEWILVIDSDEELAKESIELLRQATKQPENVVGNEFKQHRLAAADQTIIAEYEDLVTDWMNTIDAILHDTSDER